METPASRPRVVIIGGGFGGLALAQALKNAPVDITLIDRTNHHLFQPLLYQVATAALSPGDIAVSLRSIFRNQRNIELLMNEAIHIDRKHKRVYLRSKDAVQYDYLVLAVGAEPTYFGQNDWEASAPGLKSLSDALKIRERLLLSFEMAQGMTHAAERQRCLTFVMVGGGPTGVEMAGAIAEMGEKTMRSEYPKLRDEKINVYLIDGGDRILSAYPPELSEKAKQSLEELGVTVLLNARVQDLTDEYVIAGGQVIPTQNVVWAAGNAASPLLKTLETELDRMGRAVVLPDLSLPNDPNVFVIGDAACFATESGTLPGVAQVAMQMGAHLSAIIAEKQPREWRKPFKYWDKGNMATIGRARAIAQIGRLQLSGLAAWLIWSFIHVAFLINFRSRFRVMLEWIWFYLTYQPGARLIYWQSKRKQREKWNHAKKV